MDKQYNILIAGVGGQGNLVCGRVIAEAALKEGLIPTIGETFGASRRGGTVFTHLRLADRELGPLIPKGHLDLLLGLEPLETLRGALKIASSRTTAILSTVAIETPDSLAGKTNYPEVSDIISSLRDLCGIVHAIDPTESLERIGTRGVLNTYMLGTIAHGAALPIDAKILKETLKTTLSSWDINKTAFEAGVKDIAELIAD
jgi:indolepyruvate ferredoxin oxidoreductase beta subunit